MMNSKAFRSSLWFVVPAYDEAAVIGDVARGILEHYEHVIVVDDGSSDTTYQEAREAGAIVVRHPINLGQGAALQTGITYALQQGADMIVTFDADGQHRVEDVAKMAEALVEAGADVALGSRFLGDAIALPRFRRVVLRLAVLFTMLTTGQKVTDAHNGLRVFTRRAAESITIHQNGMAHASEIISEIARLGLESVEVPVTIVYTEYSLRKGQRVGNIAGILNDLLMKRFQK